MRLRAVIEYDGGDFGGWQRQTRARTVQGEIEAGIRSITGEASSVVGAGRTDAGVHASGQVAHFDTIWKRDAAELLRALNAKLAHDVAIVSLSVAPPGFHARFSAIGRVYRYDLNLSPTRSPLRRRVTLHVPSALDVGLMAAAAAELVGTHDFQGFGRPLARGGPTIRRIDRFDIAAAPYGVACEVDGNAFLRHQVRRMVGLLVDIGRGSLPPESARAVLTGRPDAPVARKLGPQGLSLTEVRYPSDEEIRNAPALWGNSMGES